MQITITHQELMNKVSDLFKTYTIHEIDAYELKHLIYFAKEAKTEQEWTRNAKQILDLCETIANNNW